MSTAASPAPRDPRIPEDVAEPSDVESADEPAAGRPAATTGEPEWWEAEGLPWKRKPTREELVCYSLLMFYAVYSLAMYPLRAGLITVPVVSAILNGARTAIAMVGAFTATGHLPVWGGVLVWFIASLSAVKWDLLYWWAGKLWGEAFVQMVAGKKGRGKQLSKKLEELAGKRPIVSIFVTYLPIPFTAVIYVVLGAARFSWKKFLAIDIVWSMLWNAGYFALGWYIGKPAVDLLLAYSKYAMWVGIALGVIVFIYAYRQQVQQMRGSEARRPS